MAVFRRRLIFWLVRAYLKKWGKVIFLSFFGGLAIFFILLATSSKLAHLIHLEKRVTIGLVGIYPADAIPPIIVDKLSMGLTTIDNTGNVHPGLATSWKIEKNGKKYTFYLKKNAYFSNGVRATAKRVSYKFADVVTTTPDDYTISYELRSPFSPFLVTVSKPIFISGRTGLGDYELASVELNGNFLKTLRLVSTKNRLKTEDYEFYPNPDSLKIAFALGEITKAVGLTDMQIKNTTLTSYPNVTMQKQTNFTQLVTLFYDTQDDPFSDKKLRDALAYALPNTFSEGQRAYQSYPPTQWFYNTDLEDRVQDVAHAKVLLSGYMDDASTKQPPTVTIKTLHKYHHTADEIAKAWSAIGVKTKIQEVDTIPATFQAYLGDFNVPKDPDQYSLWHSGQVNNIMRYKNLRIDKLLEDGRVITDVNERKKLYADFQKYLVDDAPAIFLYFPNEYTASR